MLHHRRALAASVATAVLALLLAAPAGAQSPGQPLPLSTEGKIANIEPAGSTTAGGFVWRMFRNLDYPCSISGYQTFAIGTPIGDDPTEPKPLWVRMRGGGVGFFDAAGNPQPSAGNKTENKLNKLVGFSENNDLNQRINALPAGFRNVSVSMCSHDIYAGGDQTDPDNPNLTPQGGPRHTNGLFATTAAIRFVQRNFATTRTLLHGTSAGSAGTWNVAYALIKQDRPASGFIADSGVANLGSEVDQNAAGGPCARGPETLAAISARTHPLLQGENEPRQLIERGDLFTPAFNVWNRDDSNACGSVELPCTRPEDGTVEVVGGMECRMGAIGRAIERLPASRNSVNMRLCVKGNSAPDGSCTRHVVTNANPNKYPNTDPAWPADPNAVIVNWVTERLDDAPVPLEAKLLRARKLDLKRRTFVKVECKAGGYEQRTCAVELTARKRGKTVTIGKGKRDIRIEEDTRLVEVKLNSRGRKLARKAPKRGLQAKARLTVSERYTGRAGKDRRAVRIRR